MKRAAQFSHEQNVADARKFAGMLRALSGLNKPTIARVQGAALGGGTGLTAACDMAVASDDAAFSTSEVKFGIIPSVISPYVLRAIGPRHALRYFQSAERFGAAEARAWLQSPIDWHNVTFLSDDHVGLTRNVTFVNNLLFLLLEQQPADR